MGSLGVNRAAANCALCQTENPVERRKFFATVGILVSQQISGVQFIFSYTTTFFALVGISDTFIITVMHQSHNVLTAFADELYRSLSTVLRFLVSLRVSSLLRGGVDGLCLSTRTFSPCR